MSGEIVLDISRLLSRADRTTPTGIDRVELAYARWLMEAAATRLRFAALTPLGRVAALPRAGALRFVQSVGGVWEQGGEAATAKLVGQARRLLLAAISDGEARLPRAQAGKPAPTHVLVSHHHLDKPAALRRMLKATGSRFVSLVHDLIPIELPEYNRVGHDLKHATRMRTVAELSDVVIVNSQSTGAGLQPFLDAAGRAPALVAAPLGVSLGEALGAPPPTSAEPYFACVSTIEPRKNHLLLFNIWRRMASRGGPVPRLHLVGHRGWHNEAAVDVLDRSTSLRPHLQEHARLGDRALSELLGGARALLMPSFAEGYGLPVAEALAAGVPVLCSDLPTLRGVGGDAPEYLDPLDGPAWLAAVDDYARPDSPRRAAQLARIAGWRPPTWDAHFAQVAPFVLG